jgi:hypothetical protein
MFGVLAGVVAQHASSGVSGWEELGIVIAGSLIAAAVVGCIAWFIKPSHKVHIAETSLRIAFSSDLDDFRRLLRVKWVVASTSETSLFVMLERVAIMVGDDPLDRLDAALARHEIAPGQRLTLQADAEIPDLLVPGLGVDDFQVTVSYELDYGRRPLWLMRRHITGAFQADVPSNFGNTIGQTIPTWWPDGGSPRDRLFRKKPQ